MKSSNNYTILAVDDAKDSLMLLDFDLVEAGYEVITADSGNEALAMLKENKVHLILLDMYMPGISGLTTLQEVKVQNDFAHIPVIMLSSSGDEEQIVAALEFGADDYVTKPYISNVLLARIRNALRFMEKTLELETLAKIDFLTSVNNRGSFQELVGKAISLAKRNDENVSLAMFDLDLFKKVNDNFGHEAGDKALIDFAKILIDTFREYDIIGRVGGEEFAILLSHCTLNEAQCAANTLRKNIKNKPFSYYGNTIYLRISAGVVCSDTQKSSFKSLLSAADKRLYIAKTTGRDKVIYESAQNPFINNKPVCT